MKSINDPLHITIEFYPTEPYISLKYANFYAFLFHFFVDSNTFYGTLVRRIKLLLLERENQLYEKEWVLDEALSARKLHSGGTFQNVLARTLDEIIVPIFSAILLFIDQYSNFSLIEQTR